MDTLQAFSPIDLQAASLSTYGIALAIAVAAIVMSVYIIRHIFHIVFSLKTYLRKLVGIGVLEEKMTALEVRVETSLKQQETKLEASLKEQKSEAKEAKEEIFARITQVQETLINEVRTLGSRIDNLMERRK